jgi:hypothetical protein
MGRTCPDPAVTAELGGATVPMGKGVKAAKADESTLLYNEFIVYDVEQCNAKYLFRMKFEYK